jgi:hypothetical protein
MIPPPDYKLGVTTRYVPIPDVILEALCNKTSDANVRRMMMSHFTFPISHESSILSIGIVPTPEGNYPELGTHMFLVSIACGRERLGAFMFEHWGHGVEHDYEDEEAHEWYCHKCGVALCLSHESLTGISF